jgi:hypothetical protein
MPQRDFQFVAPEIPDLLREENLRRTLGGKFRTVFHSLKGTGSQEFLTGEPLKLAILMRQVKSTYSAVGWRLYTELGQSFLQLLDENKTLDESTLEKAVEDRLMEAGKEWQQKISYLRDGVTQISAQALRVSAEWIKDGKPVEMRRHAEDISRTARDYAALLDWNGRFFTRYKEWFQDQAKAKDKNTAAAASSVEGRAIHEEYHRMLKTQKLEDNPQIKDADKDLVARLEDIRQKGPLPDLCGMVLSQLGKIIQKKESIRTSVKEKMPKGTGPSNVDLAMKAYFEHLEAMQRTVRDLQSPPSESST